MVYVIAFIMGSLLAYVSFMVGSMHGYDKGFEDCRQITQDTFDEVSKDLSELITKQEENNDE